MKLTFKIIVLLMAVNVRSLLADSLLCESILSTQKNHLIAEQVDGRLKPLEQLELYWKMYVKPKSIVRMQALQNGDATTNLKTDVRVKAIAKIAFLNLKEVSLTSDEISQVEHHRKLVTDFKKQLDSFNYSNEIKELKDKKGCIDYLQTHPHIIQILSKLGSSVNILSSLFMKYQNQEIYKEALKQKRFLQKDGWLVIERENVNGMYRHIQTAGASNVLFIGHADENGRLFDHEMNEIPKGFFHSIQAYVPNLILFNCNSEEVIKHYSLRDNLTIDVYYPTPKESMVPFIGNGAPISSLKAIRSIQFNKKASTSKAECGLHSTTTKNQVIGIFLNGNYVGPTGTQLSFPCHLIEGKNVIELYSITTKRHKGSLQLEELTVCTSKECYQVQASEYISKITNNHIATTANFILTKEEKDETL